MSAITDRLGQVLPAEAFEAAGAQEEEPRSIASVAPCDEPQWQAVLRVAAEESWRVLPMGNGSQLARQHPSTIPAHDLALSTRNMRGVLAYEPGDGTLTACAGSSMHQLAQAVRRGGHHLSPDVASPDRTTLGGVLAAGTSGLERLRYGPVRHNVLGVRALLADGSLTRSGGNLVKNVTGYDLHRLYCGSAGTLCVLLEASLRLYPLPRERLAVRKAYARREDALAAARLLLDEPIRPEALFVQGQELFTFLAGHPDVVSWELARCQEHLGGAQVVRADQVEALWTGLRDELPDGPALELSTRPSRLAGALTALEEAAASHGADTTIRSHPGLGGASVRFFFRSGPGPEGEPAPEGEQASLGLARNLTSVLRRFDAQVAWQGVPLDREILVPPHIIEQELKDSLDPAALFPHPLSHDG